MTFKLVKIMSFVITGSETRTAERHTGRHPTCSATISKIISCPYKTASCRIIVFFQFASQGIKS
ncbi:unnamed protein product [Schistosoma curassoni]|uniref:Secreted protein n=1 Tax=Schistosoma curassoni TaxID=6186 RepID=A0A183K561_9TREM|nr:unnamed protein product [Schistosoma curassoni]